MTVVGVHHIFCEVRSREASRDVLLLKVWHLVGRSNSLLSPLYFPLPFPLLSSHPPYFSRHRVDH
jgi:hypothetical protein